MLRLISDGDINADDGDGDTMLECTINFDDVDIDRQRN